MSQNRMKKKRKQSRRKQKIWIIFGILIVFLILIGALWKVSGLKKEKDIPKEEIEATDLVNKIEFPYEIEEGKIEIASLFQYSGMNPDCHDEYEEDIASLEIVNKSEEQLSDANIKVTLEDGTVLEFIVTDIPAGHTVWAYEIDNKSYDTSVACIDVSCKAEFDNTETLMENKLMIEVQDTEVKLTNISEEELTNVIVSCHCLFEEVYFGGLTYRYPVDKISAGESITFQAEECYIGEAAVVRISQDGE